MSDRAWGRKQLRLMHAAQKGLCYWCHKPTFLPEEDGYYRKAGKPTALAKMAATVDHVYSRLHPWRRRPSSLLPGPRHVMACSGCNLRRARVENIIWHRDGQLEPRIYRPDEPLESRAERNRQRAARLAKIP